MTAPARAPHARRVATVLASLSLLAATAACSGDDDSPAAGDGGSSTSATVPPSDLPTPPPVTKPVGAVADTKVGECSTDAGRQRVAGTVKNTSKAPADFVVAINWTNDTPEVIARGVAVVRGVAPGASAKWSVSAEVPEGATACVPNVLRGRLG